jgi:hypothetical protein
MWDSLGLKAIRPINYHIIRGKPIKSPLWLIASVESRGINKMRFNKIETIKISF